MKYALLALALAATPASAGDFSISFTWGDIPACHSGHPGTVGSPRFQVQGLPKGTDTLDLRLKDLDAPGYNHGGGRLKISGDVVIPFGTFRYRSPCPPGGVHRYEWRATARGNGQVLGRAKAMRKYPE